ESRLEGLRSREGSDSERVRPGGRKVWTLERILGVLSENSGYEILRFWQKFLMSYLGLDFVRGCALPRACLTRTALPQPWWAKSSAGGSLSISNHLSSATAFPGVVLMLRVKAR